MWKAVDVVHLNVTLGKCLDKLGEMKSVTAFLPSDVLRNFDIVIVFVSVIVHCEAVAAWILLQCALVQLRMRRVARWASCGNGDVLTWIFQQLRQTLIAKFIRYVYNREEGVSRSVVLLWLGQLYIHNAYYTFAHIYIYIYIYILNLTYQLMHFNIQ